MSSINDLLTQVTDPILKAKLEAEIDKLTKNKKFGLVFEDHLPERTPLYDIPVKKGSLVAQKTGKISDVYRVLKINGEVAECEKKGSSEKESFPVVNLVSVAEFGEPIYPCLKPIDNVCNGPEEGPWHTLIEADNYHALQLLEYLYAGKVDCIYIDPPYNTGARDWKYNNDYVDSNDAYRHSKWLSMMQKRLKLTKKLLNPKDSVLVVTIDEKEYLHLGCLLEEMFPSSHIQMISIVINPNGVARDHEMYRLEEYAFFVYLGSAGPAKLKDTFFTSDVNQQKTKSEKLIEKQDVRWERLMRGGSNSARQHSPGCFYPVYIDPVARRIVDVGEPLEKSEHPSAKQDRFGLVTVWPIARGSREEKVWRMTRENLMALAKEGLAKVGAYDRNRDRWSLLYLGKAQRERIKSGELNIIGRDENGVAIVEVNCVTEVLKAPRTIWNRQSHNAGEYGSRLIRAILPGRVFAYPKSLYAVRDCLLSVVKNKPNALIVDFFSGSGTTLHAVNLLNSEDGGNRRCIMVTNNEVSEDEAKALAKQGHYPGDEDWEKLGIARYVTWPRTVCSIEGHDINGNPLKGNYIGSDRSMADGFTANAAFFKLGFLDKTSVALGHQFKEMLPTLWLKAGAFGACPDVDEPLPTMMVLPQNKLAILLDETAYPKFEKQVKDNAAIQTVFIVTDSESGYREMIASFSDKATYQLYRDYLDNFRINTGR